MFNPRPLIDRGLIQAQGFSLLELMVVVAIMGIIMTVALPSYSEFVRGQRIRSVSFDLYSNLAAGRSEGINRNVSAASRIVLEPASGAVCDADSCNWGVGWTMKHGAIVIQNQNSFGNEVTIDGPKRVEFDRTGRATITGVGGFDIQSEGSGTRRCVTIDSVGRANTKNGGC